MTRRLFLLTAVVQFAIWGSGWPFFFIHRYEDAVKSGFALIPEAAEIEQLLGESDHFISYSGASLPQVWNTEVFFYGRYSLTMQVEVKVNWNSTKVTRVMGEPIFYLHEIESIDNGGRGARFNAGGQRTFGPREWDSIVRANGDFSVVGIDLRKNAPVPDFDTYVNAVRRPRVQVRPF